MATSYSLDYFRDNSTLYNLARKFDSLEEKGNNDRILNGKEVSLFTRELKQAGIDFDFNKIENTEYLDESAENYKKEIQNKKYRENLINELKDDYDIEIFENSNGSLGYKITAKKEINLSGLKSDLGIPAGEVSKYNHGYNQWDGPNGGHVDNTPMQNKTIYISERALGKTNIIDKLCFNIKSYFNS